MCQTNQKKNKAKKELLQKRLPTRRKFEKGFECNKPGHIKADYHFLKKDLKISDPKKKAMMGTWDDKDS